MSSGRDAAPESLPCVEITGRVWCAVKRVQKADATLLAIDVHEVTVSHRLAMYLEPLFPGWHVDVEYNRIGRGREEDNPERVKRLDGNRVFPDIIVHEPGEPNNLVVVEVKLSTNQESREEVRERLRRFREAIRLEYRHGVLLDLPSGEHHPGKPYLECITCGRGATS